MPTQVLPITDIASTGILQDLPSVSLPPNAFTDALNVRFRDGAARKMEGEGLLALVPERDDIAYIAYWPGPTNQRYVIIDINGDVFLHDTDGGNGVSAGNIPITAGQTAVWQHTLFNGGFNIVINNGTGTPYFLSEDLATTTPLPGWDSYQSQEEVTTVEWAGETFGRILIGRTTVSANERFVMTVTPRNPSDPIVVSMATGPFGVSTQPGVGTFAAVTGLGGDTIDLDLNPANVEVGDTISIAIQTIPDIIVTAGVIRAYGNLLVAGDLMEMDRTDPSITRRTLPGTIRTSDVAAPGTIPGNWNPFRIGVNTADEFTLAATGRVRDMVELQGVLYVYTDTSIHSVQQTGNPTIPFQIAPVTTSYGANNTGSIIDVDGKHIVVGSDDVYVFAGHPGSISSVADGKVRFNPFFDRTDVQILRFQKYDELWFWSASTDEMFIWNYRDNTWTRRMQTAPVAGTVGHNGLYFASATSVFDVDTGFTSQSSYIERKRLAITPEFDTENLASIAMLASGTGSLDILVRGTNAPSDEDDLTLANAGRNGGAFIFNIADETDPMNIIREYKQDIRVHGRFLNYRIGTTNSFNNWSIAGYQFDIGKGGTR